MAERFIAPVLKTGDVVRRPWVRIPPHPLFLFDKLDLLRCDRTICPFAQHFLFGHYSHPSPKTLGFTMIPLLCDFTSWATQSRLGWKRISGRCKARIPIPLNMTEQATSDRIGLAQPTRRLSSLLIFVSGDALAPGFFFSSPAANASRPLYFLTSANFSGLLVKSRCVSTVP